MDRQQAINKLVSLMELLDEHHQEDQLSAAYCFGSFCRGAEDPNDLDILLVFKQSGPLYLTKKGKDLCRKYGGRKRDVHMFAMTTEEFENRYCLKVPKAELESIWDEKDTDWRKHISSLEHRSSKPEFQWSIRNRDFRYTDESVWKINYGIQRDIIRVELVDARQYFEISGPWMVEVTHCYGDGTAETEMQDEFQWLLEAKTELIERRVSQRYVDVWMLMQVYAHQHGILLDFFATHVGGNRSRYETHFISEDGGAVFVIHSVNLSQVFFQFERDQRLSDVILIPRFRRSSNNNYIYHFMRGSEWVEGIGEELSEQYRAHSLV